MKMGASLKNTLLSLKRDKPEITAETFFSWLKPVSTGLYNFILKSLNFSQDADDVYQNTIFRAYKYIHNLNQQCSFKAWIFSIGHNEIKQYYRKQKRDIMELDENIAPSVPNQDKDIIKDIYQVASQLKPVHREVFYLFYYNSYSIGEITEITGLKEGNIKFMLNHARKTIKKKLEMSDGKKDR